MRSYPAENPRLPSSYARLLVFDMATQAISSTVMFRRTVNSGPPGLVARDDGTYVVVSPAASGPGWKGYRFTISANGGLTWGGVASGAGMVLDQPIHTTWGVVLPVVQGGEFDLLRLDDDLFLGGPTSPPSL